ncbi:MAG: GNAT family N-acetyltransferase [Clostridia bacterium]|nr:GNAT family N-acetyltransferase [Clostridia bacterium]
MTRQLSVKKMITADHLDMMTKWIFDWWGKAENYSYEAVYSYMSYSLQETRLPQTYGLFLNEKLIGMYQFTMEDLFSRPDIYPWLANVYIDKAYRSCGYGRFLLNSVKETAEKAGLSELYLFTTHEGLYEKFSWDFVREIDTFLEPRIQRLYRLNNGADDQKSNKTHDLRGDN